MKRTISFCGFLVFGAAPLRRLILEADPPVVPFPAGESVMRPRASLGQSWSAALGQQILVDNRGGAGGP